MDIYEEYLKLSKQADILFDNEDFKNSKLKRREAADFRNKNFSKQDWEKLIAQSCSGRAKYEYTRMMKEKFPD